MPTTFIALQCSECSTMQVKQRKKSSNKWSCVVCNQKQSVRKVFAQGSMARDIRKFVQNFNMSRQLSDQKQYLSDELETSNSTCDEQKIRKRNDCSNSTSDEQKIRKRNDWSEYVDDQDEYCGKFHIDERLPEGDDGLEPVIVTEMPKALFKKPKLKDYSSSNGCESKKLFKPLFPNRSNAKRHQNNHHQDLHLDEFEQTSCGRASKRSDNYTMRAENICSHEEPMAPKWNHFQAQIQDNNSNLANMEEPFVGKPTKGIKGSISKWNGYITEEDDENAEVNLDMAKGPVSEWSSFIAEENDDKLENGRRGESWVRISQRSNDPLESSMKDERVEDDIHPDFL